MHETGASQGHSRDYVEPKSGANTEKYGVVGRVSLCSQVRPLLPIANFRSLFPSIQLSTSNIGQKIVHEWMHEWEAR